MDEIERFPSEVRANVDHMMADGDLHALARVWMRESARYKYTYNFSWMGRPIIQLPQDLLAMQEIIWRVKPDVIVETGIAHGGSLVYYASLLELVGGPGVVVGIDVDIRPHNRRELDAHPMAHRIRLIEGSSVDAGIVRAAAEHCRGRRSVLVVLDSNHTHAHVRRELDLYSPLVTQDSYLVVFDTLIEDLPDDLFAERPWGKGDNPKTAVHEFLKANDRFEIDRSLPGKLVFTTAPDGYLRCVRG